MLWGLLVRSSWLKVFRQSKQIKTVEHLVKETVRRTVEHFVKKTVEKTVERSVATLRKTVYVDRKTGKFRNEETTCDWESATCTQDFRQVLVFVRD